MIFWGAACGPNFFGKHILEWEDFFCWLQISTFPNVWLHGRFAFFDLYIWGRIFVVVNVGRFYTTNLGPRWWFQIFISSSLGKMDLI